MSLLSKLERLEKVASSKAVNCIEVDPELIAFAGRLLAEIKARPEPTIHQEIEWHRQQIIKSETSGSTEDSEIFLKPMCQAFEPWHRAELARLEAELAKLQ